MKKTTRRVTVMKSKPKPKPATTTLMVRGTRAAEVLPALHAPQPLSPLSVEPTMIASFVGTLKLSQEQIAALRRQVAYDEIDWKPAAKDGPDIIPYLSHNGYRDRLDAAFGLGGWGMVQMGVHRRDGDFVYTPFALIIDGLPRVYAWGEQQVHKMTLGDALEGAKSNAIVRCGKELGIARELWDKKTLLKLQAQKRFGEKGPVREAPAAGRPAPATEPGPSEAYGRPEQPISEPQRKRLFAIAKNAGRTKPELAVWLAGRWNVTSTKDITRGTYNDIIAEIEKPGPLQVPEADEPGSYDGD